MINNKNIHNLINLIIIIMVILISVKEIIIGSYNNLFICILTLLLISIVIIIDKIFNIKISKFLKTYIIIFIFLAEILGEILDFYSKIVYWDFILHIISGFIITGLCLSIIKKVIKNILNYNVFLILVISFCFSVTISVFWEFFEYLSDNYYFKTDMQKDKIVKKISSISLSNNYILSKINNIKYTIVYIENNEGISEIKIDNGYLDIGLHDTMSDLLANIIGTSFFSFLAYFYIKRKKFNFIELFIFS